MLVSCCGFAFQILLQDVPPVIDRVPGFVHQGPGDCGFPRIAVSPAWRWARTAVGAIPSQARQSPAHDGFVHPGMGGDPERGTWPRWLEHALVWATGSEQPGAITMSRTFAGRRSETLRRSEKCSESSAAKKQADVFRGFYRTTHGPTDALRPRRSHRSAQLGKQSESIALVRPCPGVRFASLSPKEDRSP